MSTVELLCEHYPNCPNPHALISLRISRLTEASTANARQEAHAVPFAKGAGYCVIGIAEDKDVSGAVSVFDRPELGKWLRDHAAKFNAIVFHKIDRLTRNLFDFVDMIRWADEHNVKLICKDPMIDFTSPEGRLIGMILAHFAEAERQTMKARALDARTTNLQEGKWIGGRRPYWTDKEKIAGASGWKLKLNPARVKTVKKIITMMLEGAPYTEIRDHLHAEGIPCPQGPREKGKEGRITAGTWRASTIKDICQNPALLGFREVGIEGEDGEKCTDLVRGPDGRPIKFVKAIIEESRWRKLQAEIYRRDQSDTKKTRRDSPGRGIFKCLICNSNLSYSSSERKGKRYAYYRCITRNSPVPCGHSLVVPFDIYEAIERELIDSYATKEIRTKVEDNGDDVSAEIADLEESAKNIANRLSKMRSPKIIEHLEAQLAAIDEDLAKLYEQQADRHDVIEYVPTGETLGDLWGRLDEFGRCSLLDELGVIIRANGKVIHVVAPEDVEQRLTDVTSGQVVSPVKHLFPHPATEYLTKENDK